MQRLHSKTLEALLFLLYLWFPCSFSLFFLLVMKWQDRSQRREGICLLWLTCRVSRWVHTRKYSRACQEMKSGRRTLLWERGLVSIDSKEMQGQETFLMSKSVSIAWQKVWPSYYAMHHAFVDIHSLTNTKYRNREACLAVRSTLCMPFAFQVKVLGEEEKNDMEKWRFFRENYTRKGLFTELFDERREECVLLAQNKACLIRHVEIAKQRTNKWIWMSISFWGNKTGDEKTCSVLSVDSLHKWQAITDKSESRREGRVGLFIYFSQMYSYQQLLSWNYMFM